MRTLGIAALIATVGAAAVMAASAPAAVGGGTKIVPFIAKYSGTAVVNVNDQVADITATGAGTGTLLGKSKLAGKGKGDASVQPCVPFAGPGSMIAGANKLLFTVTPGSQGCGDEAGQVFSISGKAKVTGGAGKLRKARGILKFSGVYDRGAGTFSVKFTGKLTV